jgi:hypothetical protein
MKRNKKVTNQMTNIKPPRGFIRVTDYKTSSVSLIRISSIIRIWHRAGDRFTIINYDVNGDHYVNTKETTEEIAKMIDDDGAVTTELADVKKSIADLICENQGLKHKIDDIIILMADIRNQVMSDNGSEWDIDSLYNRLDCMIKQQTKETGK